jgi:hypothetical protein
MRAPVGLTGAWQALDRKDAFMEVGRHTERRILRRLTLLLEGLAVKPWRDRHQQIPCRSIVALAGHAMAGNVFTYTHERLGEHLSSNKAVREDRVRVQVSCVTALLDVNHALIPRKIGHAPEFLAA